jgi:hypothetical protein
MSNTTSCKRGGATFAVISDQRGHALVSDAIKQSTARVHVRQPSCVSVNPPLWPALGYFKRFPRASLQGRV